MKPMQLLVTGLVDATTRVTVLATATNLVWSPGQIKFVGQAPDAVLVPSQCKQPGLGSIGTVSIPGLAQPVGNNDYVLIYVGPDGLPIGKPQPVYPVTNPTPAVIVVTGQVVNLGGG